jgi:hypothetical protein
VLSQRVFGLDGSTSNVQRLQANWRCRSRGEQIGGDKSDRLVVVYPGASDRSNSV